MWCQTRFFGSEKKQNFIRTNASYDFKSLRKQIPYRISFHVGPSPRRFRAFSHARMVLCSTPNRLLVMYSELPLIKKLIASRSVVSTTAHWSLLQVDFPESLKPKRWSVNQFFFKKIPRSNVQITSSLLKENLKFERLKPLTGTKPKMLDGGHLKKIQQKTGKFLCVSMQKTR